MFCCLRLPPREMTELELLINRVRQTSTCRILPAAGHPRVDARYVLPEDLAYFYELAGGAVLFEEAPFPFFIVGPHELLPSNPEIVGKPCLDDISSSWHIVARDPNGDCLTIDLDRGRAGRCYDSFHETHGLIGQTPVIARSFTELVHRLYEGGGQYPYWLHETLCPL